MKYFYLITYGNKIHLSKESDIDSICGNRGKKNVYELIKDNGIDFEFNCNEKNITINLDEMCKRCIEIYRRYRK